MRDRGSRLALLLALALCLPGMSPRRANQPSLLGTQIFPADNPWNWDMSAHNVHPNSANFISSIGNGVSLRADFSFEINVVPGTQPLVPVGFGIYSDESDPGPGFGSPAPGGDTPTGMYPIPPGARVEGGTDAHCIVVDTGNLMLYETGNTAYSAGTGWSASGGSVWNLQTNALRPAGYTSTDAAGLPILPGLLRHDEIASANPITHALRVTVPHSQNKYYYPARHHAGTANANYPPMGTRIRLKAGKDISGFTGTPRKVLDALKKYGLIVADNTGASGAWYISTTVDDDWGTDSPYINHSTQGILAIHGSDMEAIESVYSDGSPILPGAIPPPPPPIGGGSGGGGGGGGCGATGVEAFLVLMGLAVGLRLSRSARP